jgi:hypothetical protein
MDSWRIHGAVITTPLPLHIAPNSMFSPGQLPISPLGKSFATTALFTVTDVPNV